MVQENKCLLEEGATQTSHQPEYKNFLFSTINTGVNTLLQGSSLNSNI
jgi:hypothetical protein